MPANRFFVGIAAILLATGGTYFYFQQTTPGTSIAGSERAAVATTASAPLPADLADSDNPAERLAILYLERYGDTIDQIKTQLELYGERAEARETYPDRGDQLFEQAVHIAFPELADSILGLLAKFDHYNLWLDDNELRLQGLSVMNRQAALWQKREEVFGVLANDIWDRSESELEQKAETFQRELARLSEARGQSLQELAYQLQSTVEELYGNDMTYQLTGSGALGRTLFKMDSVQSQLKALPPADRQAAINELRRQLGYPEEAIEKLAEQDQARAEKWETGKTYMAEREQLAETLSGEQLDQALQELRQEHFGNSAVTIRKEEEGGFYRFERKRQYGIN